jgi:hypothetical protein
VNIVSETAQLYLAQRIAKVRSCMLVEVATGVSPTDKDLFVSLCQMYEQQGAETFCLLGESHESLLYWVSPIFSLTQGTTELLWPISMLKRSFSLWQQGVDLLVANQADLGWTGGWTDWQDRDR